MLRMPRQREIFIGTVTSRKIAVIIDEIALENCELSVNGKVFSKYNQLDISRNASICDAITRKWNIDCRL